LDTGNKADWVVEEASYADAVDLGNEWAHFEDTVDIADDGVFGMELLVGHSAEAEADNKAGLDMVVIADIDVGEAAVEAMATGDSQDSQGIVAEGAWEAVILYPDQMLDLIVSGWETL